MVIVYIMRALKQPENFVLKIKRQRLHPLTRSKFYCGKAISCFPSGYDLYNKKIKNGARFIFIPYKDEEIFKTKDSMYTNRLESLYEPLISVDEQKIFSIYFTTIVAKPTLFAEKAM